MSKTDRGLLRSSARTRLLVAGGVGIGSGVATALLGGGAFALAAGWAAGSLVFLVWVWGAIARMSPAETRTHALLEDDTRTGSHVALVVAALASLAALVVMLVAAGSLGSPLREWLTGAGLVTVMLSWCVVQTLYTLRYAHLHYLDAPNGIDFNQDGDADYLDFAYVAFTMGMTYQCRTRTSADRHSVARGSGTRSSRSCSARSCSRRRSISSRVSRRRAEWHVGVGSARSLVATRDRPS